MDWLNLFTYILYCFLHFCYRWIRENIVWRFNGVRDHLERIRRPSNDITEETRTCQIFKILYRRKISPLDLAQPSSDFVCTHESFANLKDTLGDDPRWTLYGIDKRESVYFVEMPEPLKWYNAERSPLLYVTQFDECTRMARVPGWAFRRYAEDELSDPIGRVVFCTNAARSGSTLLTRVIQACDETDDAPTEDEEEQHRNRIVCFSEPDFFTNLTILMEDGTLDEKRMTDLLRACLRYFCKDQPLATTYFIKTRSTCARLVSNVKSAVPEVKHVFTFRKDATRAIGSMAKLIRKGGGDGICLLSRVSLRLAFATVPMSKCEYEMSVRYGIEDCTAFAMVSYVSSFRNYHRYRDIYDTPVIYYEEMIEEPARVLKPVLELCELNYERAIERAMEEMRFDSQGGTVISRRSLSNVPSDGFDEDRRRKLTRMFDELKLPKVWY